MQTWGEWKKRGGVKTRVTTGPKSAIAAQRTRKLCRNGSTLQGFVRSLFFSETLYQSMMVDQTLRFGLHVMLIPCPLLAYPVLAASRFSDKSLRERLICKNRVWLLGWGSSRLPLPYSPPDIRGVKTSRRKWNTGLGLSSANPSHTKRLGLPWYRQKIWAQWKKIW